MANEEKKGGALAKAAINLPTIDAKAAAAALRQSSNEASTGGGDFEFLSFSGKQGTYQIGRDRNEPDPDAVYIVEPMAAVEGWNCWKGGKPVAKHEWSLYERAAKAVRADDLADHGPYNERAGEGWQFMLGIGMFDVDEPSKQIKFTTSSVSGRNVFSDLNSLIADEMIEGGDGIALIQLGKEQFEAHGQKNYKPVIDVLGMVSRAEVEAFLEEDEYDVDDLLEGRCVPKEEPEQEPDEVEAATPAEEPEVEEKKPARKGRSTAAKKEEPVKEEAAPSPRRRRRAAA